MSDKMCRICWNTNGWRKPSGAVNERGKSFAARHGFGMEEWLFNYDWCINGFKYGYLTPFNQENPTGKTFNVALYTLVKPNDWRFVATISDVYVPKLDELKNAFEIMKKRGWVNQMRENISHIVGENRARFRHLGSLNALNKQLACPSRGVINVRFHPNDVGFFDPKPRIDVKNPRYLLFSRNFENLEIKLEPSAPADPPARSEESQKRAAQQGTTVEPRHVRLQNRLYETLCRHHRKGNVEYEEDYVDLKVRGPKGWTFYEIKMDTSAKRCIRNALGQLLEYSSYPTAQRAQKLVVVGDASATENDIQYLRHLRKHYSLPIHYAQFNWEKKDIEREV